MTGKWWRVRDAPPRSWEIVVADNNSTDDTRDVVARFAESGPAPVRYMFEPRQGVSHARNAALATASGAVLAFMDDDVRPAEDWLAAVLAALAREDADIVGGRILPLWESPPPAWLEDNAQLYDYLALMTYPDRHRLGLPFVTTPRIWSVPRFLLGAILAGSGRVALSALTLRAARGFPRAQISASISSARVPWKPC